MKQFEQFLYTLPTSNKDVEFPNKNECAYINPQTALLCFEFKPTGYFLFDKKQSLLLTCKQSCWIPMSLPARPIWVYLETLQVHPRMSRSKGFWDISWATSKSSSVLSAPVFLLTLAKAEPLLLRLYNFFLLKQWLLAIAKLLLFCHRAFLNMRSCQWSLASSLPSV